MNLIPVIREALGLQEHEEFNLINANEVPFPERFRFTSNSLQIHYPQGWEEAHDMTLRALLTGRYTIVKKPWKPTKEERYWYVLSDRYVVDTTFDPYCCYDLAFYTFGNCFRTKEEITPEVLEETWQKCYGAYFHDDKHDGAQQ